MFTSDPVADFHSYDAEQEEKLNRLPVCKYCGEKIQDEHYFEIDGEIYCEEHMIELFRKNTYEW